MTTPLLPLVLLAALLPTHGYAVDKDLFDNDADTRRPASVEEAAYAVRIGRKCTGVPLSPTHILTAAHCVRRLHDFRGEIGQSAAAPEQGRFRLREILEYVPGTWDEHATPPQLDYAIIEVEWLGTLPPPVQKYVHALALEPGALTFGADADATALHTIGFPADKRDRRAIYSSGYAKAYLPDSDPDDRLRYNMGVINGNSGGPIYTSAGTHLVGLVIGGRHDYRDPASTGNDPEDPEAWNYGAHIRDIREHSSVLKALFPDGISVVANVDGRVSRDSQRIFDREGRPYLTRPHPMTAIWRDDSQRQWKLGPLTPTNWNAARTACAEPWALPTPDHVDAALASGLDDPTRNAPFGDVLKDFIKTAWTGTENLYAYLPDRSTHAERFRRPHGVLCTKTSP